jgi:putative ABC transport system substrate-binding protein
MGKLRKQFVGIWFSALLSARGLCAAVFLAQCSLLLAPCVPGHAQQPTKIPRIGFLIASSRSVNAARYETFLQGLRELGYEEGKNIVIEWRSAEGRLDRLAALAAELIRLKVDVIVTAGPSDTRAAKEATSTIPIVMTFDNDPVGNGFIASLARPGGNITGLSTLAPELSSKQLELLKEIVPKLSRVAILGSSNNPGNTLVLREIEDAAKTFGLKFQYLDLLDPNAIEAAFRTASKGGAEAIVVLGIPLLNPQRKQLVELAVKNRLPAIYYTGDMVEAGGLMTYGVNRSDLTRRAATYVDKILKGTKPADLPVEQPRKFDFIINLKAAKQIGLTIPPNVLARADRVIR